MAKSSHMPLFVVGALAIAFFMGRESTPTSPPSYLAADASESDGTAFAFASGDDTPVYDDAPAYAAMPIYYRNCTAARRAGAAPVYRGDPGYAAHLDRDDDGIGCE